MYNIAICDDEPIFANYLEDKLIKILPEFLNDYKIDVFNSPALLINNIISKKVYYKVLFLDIIMNDINGIKLAKQIRNLGLNCNIVFVTCSTEFALPSFEVVPTHYLIKPPQENDLREALRRIVNTIPSESVILVEGKDDDKNIVVLNEVAFLEIFRTDIYIHLINGTTINCVGSLKSISEKLDETLFYRCHRSYIVNLKHVFSITRYNYILKNSAKVPIAKNRYKEAVTQITNFLIN